MYDDDELMEEKSFKGMSDDTYSDLDEPLDPLEESASDSKENDLDSQ